jgi:uncharacterized NAD(P)/FAD-binding protein YdhS
MRAVAIVGGGFCGTVTAVNLARLATTPLAVTVFNHRYPPARGVAYGTRRPEHLLNVPARNMSALADRPDHFVEWLRARGDFAGVPLPALREQFIPRRVYGDYLQALLEQARSPAGGGKVRIDWVEAEVQDIVPGPAGVRVVASGGRSLVADKVVLATGHLPPAEPEGLDLDHPRCIRDPWQDWEGRLPDPGSPVLLLGTGLTALDVFLTLDALGWRGKVHAVSRNGLLPLPHAPAADYPDFKGEDLAGLDLEGMWALLRGHCAKARALGIGPGALVDKVRAWTQRLWQGLGVADKRRFLREFRARWNVARHRAPQAAYRKVTDAIAGGRLEVHKGRVRSLPSDAACVRVAVDDGTGAERVLEAGALFNCTGPQEGCTLAGSTLLRNLLARGLVAADELGLGIRVTADFAALERGGERSPHLLALGSILKGTLWETTAVPELRQQAFRVAESIAAGAHAVRVEAGPPALTGGPVHQPSLPGSRGPL